MPKLLSHISNPDWIKPDTGETEAQKFFFDYGRTVDSNGFMEGNGLKYYSKDVTFHNQNGAEYHGGEEMWAWMKRLFGQFRKLSHDVHEVWDIQEDDGTNSLMVQMTRNIWMHGNDSDKADVSAPAFWVCKIGPADIDYSDAFMGLQFKEVWIYWDTMLLAPHMGKDAVAFKTKNIIEHS